MNSSKEIDQPFRLFYVPGEKENLRAIGHKLVEDRDAMCVNILPIESSIYRDQEGIKEETEHVAIIKMVLKDTTHCYQIFRKIERLHSYHTPSIVQLPPIRYCNDKLIEFARKLGFRITRLYDEQS